MDGYIATQRDYEFPADNLTAERQNQSEAVVFCGCLLDCVGVYSFYNRVNPSDQVDVPERLRKATKDADYSVVFFLNLPPEDLWTPNGIWRLEDGSVHLVDTYEQARDLHANLKFTYERHCLAKGIKIIDIGFTTVETAVSDAATTIENSLLGLLPNEVSNYRLPIEHWNQRVDYFISSALEGFSLGDLSNDLDRSLLNHFRIRLPDSKEFFRQAFVDIVFSSVNGSDFSRTRDLITTLQRDSTIRDFIAQNLLGLPDDVVRELMISY